MMMKRLVIAVLAVWITLLGVNGNVWAQESGSKDDLKKTAMKGAMYSLQMHADLLEAIEEALGYVALNDKSEKEDFFKKIKDFDAVAAKTQELLKGYKNLAEGLDKLLVAKKQLVTDAEALFKAFEASKAVPDKEIKAFEASVDSVTQMYEDFLKIAISEDVKDGIMKKKDTAVALQVVSMHADIMEAIEEAFAYPLLGDKAEMEDALKKMKDFDKEAEKLEKSGVLSGAISKADYDLLKAAKEKVEATAKAMWEKSEIGKKVDVGAAKEFEAAVDDLSEHLDGLTEDCVEKAFK